MINKPPYFLVYSRSKRRSRRRFRLNGSGTKGFKWAGVTTNETAVFVGVRIFASLHGTVGSSQQ